MTELLFLHSARWLMLVDNWIKFQSEHGFCDGQSSKENNSQRIKGRVTIVALCTLSHAN